MRNIISVNELRRVSWRKTMFVKPVSRGGCGLELASGQRELAGELALGTRLIPGSTLPASLRWPLARDESRLAMMQAMNHANR